MQAIASFNIIPPKFLPPVKLPPVQPNIPVPNVIDVAPRAISITAPTGGHEVITPEIDDKVTAFWDYQFLFVSQRSETTEPITLRVVDGSIPTDFPSGSYYLTGPGVFADDHGSTVHPLDGHGYLRKFEIDGSKGKVEFMAKYIETEALVEERDRETGSWRFTHRGPFSVLKGEKMVGNTKVMKNVANTSVLRWGGRLFCLWEGGNPYEMESRTLDTIGKFEIIKSFELLKKDLESNKVGFIDVAAKILKPILYGVFKMPPKRLLSHYKVDTKRNRLLMMACNAEDMLLPRSHFAFYEFDSNFKMLKCQEFDIPDHLMIHDWAFTDSHYILFGNRIKLDIPGSMAAVCGLSPMISALSVNASKPTSPIYLLPRDGGSKLISGQRNWKIPIEAPSQLWVLHVGNAYEYKDENGISQIQIQASGCSYGWFNFQKMFGYDWQSGKLDPAMMNCQDKSLPHLIQVSISLDRTGENQKCNVEALNEWSKPTDFPVINQEFSGCENSYVYAATCSGSRQALPHFPFDTVVKLNTKDKSIQKWSTGRRRFIGEPIFVPKGIVEDDGYLLVVEYAVSTQKCYLVILDAKQIGKSNALVARAEVPRHFNFPLGFHGFWAGK